MAYTSKPSAIPEFAILDQVDPVTSTNNVVEPPTAKKNYGWNYLEKPARNYFNWLHRFNYLWIEYFNQFFSSSHELQVNDVISESGNGINFGEYFGYNIETPLAQIHLHEGSSDGNLLHFTNTTTGATLSDGFSVGLDASENAILLNRENTDLILSTNNAEYLRLNNTGFIDLSYPFSTNIGIGVSPSNPLHVQSTTTPQVRVAYDANSYWTVNVADGSNLTLTSGESTGQLLFYPGSATPYVTIYSPGVTAQLNISSSDNAEFIYFQHNGTNGIINTAGTSAGSVTIPNITNSSSSTTGAVIIGSGGNGGLGVAEDIYAGADIHAGASLYAASNLAVTGNYTLPIKVTDSTVSSSYSTGCAILSGGLGVAEDIYAQYNIHSTSGYFLSGKGRWPTGSLEDASAPTRNEVFDALSPSIPNTNDEIILTGGIYDSVPYIVVRAIRTGATTIDVYVIRADTGSISALTMTDGSGSTLGSISISW